MTVLEDPHQHALELWRSGRQAAEIAAQLGVSKNTVTRWCDPRFAEADRARSREWKRRNPVRQREYDRRRRLGLRVPCPGCGQPMGHVSELCRGCHKAAAVRRQLQIEAWWHEGLKVREIARRLEMTELHVGQEIHRMRIDGFDLPYRRRVT